MKFSGNPPFDLDELYGLFGDRAPEGHEVPAEEMPASARRLLAHHDHMTVTLERHHGGPVELDPLDVVEEGMLYARRILLRRPSDRVVMFGVMRFDLSSIEASLCERIRSGTTPLGRLLIDDGRLRRIDTHTLVTIEVDRQHRDWMKLRADDGPLPNRAWGRLATLSVDGSPAVSLLEVVPEDAYYEAT